MVSVAAFVNLFDFVVFGAFPAPLALRRLEILAKPLILLGVREC
jgi:hypothetical protein